MTKHATLLDADSGRMILQTLELAHTPWTRFWGLMLRRSVPASYGIWIRPCRSIHTMWMRMRIDVFFLSGNLTVLGVRPDVVPWRIVIAPRGTHSVLETPSGQTQLPIGRRLLIAEV